MFAARTALHSGIYPRCVRASEFQHVRNINVRVDGDTRRRCRYDKACVHKNENICKEQMALRHIQHNYCHQHARDNGAQCPTYSQIQSVSWVRAITG